MSKNNRTKSYDNSNNPRPPGRNRITDKRSNSNGDIEFVETNPEVMLE